MGEEKQRRTIFFKVFPKVFYDGEAFWFRESTFTVIVEAVCLEAGRDVDMVMPDILTTGGLIVLAGGWRLMSPASCDGGEKSPRMRDSLAVDESF